MKLIQKPTRMLNGNFNFKKVDEINNVARNESVKNKMPSFPIYSQGKSKAFRDFDKEFRKNAYKSKLDPKYENMNFYGVGANGFKKSEGEKKDSASVKIINIEGIKVDMDDKEEDVEEQEQLYHNGPEARGYKVFSTSKAKAEVNKRTIKTNRGNLANNLSGQFASGLRRRQYEKQTKTFDDDEAIQNDDEFIDLDKEVEEEFYEYTSMKKQLRD